MICFILGMPGWKHRGARQAVTGLVFLVQSMFMCRSDVDAKRQTLYLGGGLKRGSPVFEHKWATLNSNHHMAVDVTAVTIVAVPSKSFQILHTV